MGNERTFFPICKRKGHLSCLQELIPYFQLLSDITQGQHGRNFLFSSPEGVRSGTFGLCLALEPQTGSVPPVLLEVVVGDSEWIFPLKQYCLWFFGPQPTPAACWGDREEKARALDSDYLVQPRLCYILALRPWGSDSTSQSLTYPVCQCWETILQRASAVSGSLVTAFALGYVFKDIHLANSFGR